MEYIIDLTNVNNKEELFVIIKEALNLPDYFGNNLDALYDSLQEKDLNNTTIHITNGLVYESNNQDYFNKLRNLFNILKDENPGLNIEYDYYLI